MTKNILQVIPQLNAGGAEQTTLEITEALVREGSRAFVVSQGGRLEHKISQLGGIFKRRPVHSKNPFILLTNALYLKHFIRTNTIHLIHARSRAPAWSARLAAHWANIPFVTTYHGVYQASSSLKKAYNAVMTRGDQIIANSEFIRQHILKTYSVQDEKIVVIPRGVDPDQFDPDAFSPERIKAMRASWKIDPSSPAHIILLPARLVRWKGQSIALEALAYLRKNHGLRAYLVFLGDEASHQGYKLELEKQAQYLDVKQWVKWPGHGMDMPCAYAACDLVLSPALEPEAFGRVAIEAQAMRKQVIASDHGGTRETVLHGRTGWLTPVGDSQALASLIYRALCLDEASKKDMVCAARERVKKLFSTHVLQTKTLQVYQNLLKL